MTSAEKKAVREALEIGKRYSELYHDIGGIEDTQYISEALAILDKSEGVEERWIPVEGQVFKKIKSDEELQVTDGKMVLQGRLVLADGKYHLGLRGEDGFYWWIDFEATHYRRLPAPPKEEKE